MRKSSIVHNSCYTVPLLSYSFKCEFRHRCMDVICWPCVGAKCALNTLRASSIAVSLSVPRVIAVQMQQRLKAVCVCAGSVWKACVHVPASTYLHAMSCAIVCFTRRELYIDFPSPWKHRLPGLRSAEVLLSSSAFASPAHDFLRSWRLPRSVLAGRGLVCAPHCPRSQPRHEHGKLG